MIVILQFVKKVNLVIGYFQRTTLLGDHALHFHSFVGKNLNVNPIPTLSFKS